MSEQSDSKITNIIKSSGNSFQVKVVNFFREKSWEVIVSPYYNDNVTDIPREIDLIAYKSFPYSGFLNRNNGNIRVCLFIECKYISKEAVFWFDVKDTDKAINRVTRDTGLEHPDKNEAIKSHHLIQATDVAKLFAATSDKNMAPEKDLIYKAINQCLNATMYFKNRRTLFSEDKHAIPPSRTLNYPLVVCNSFDKFYKTDFANKDPEKIDTNFVLEINYAYLNADRKRSDEYFLIDFVDFNKIETFLNMLEECDIKAVKNHCSASAYRNGFNEISEGSWSD